MIYILNERFMFFMNMWKRVDGTSACREKQCRLNPVMFQSMTRIKSGNWPKNSYNIFAGTNTYMEKCMTHLMEFRSSVRTWNKNVEEKNDYMTISMHDVKNPSRQSPYLARIAALKFMTHSQSRMTHVRMCHFLCCHSARQHIAV